MLKVISNLTENYSRYNHLLFRYSSDVSGVRKSQIKVYPLPLFRIYLLATLNKKSLRN